MARILTCYDEAGHSLHIDFEPNDPQVRELRALLNHTLQEATEPAAPRPRRWRRRKSAPAQTDAETGWEAAGAAFRAGDQKTMILLGTHRQNSDSRIVIGDHNQRWLDIMFFGKIEEAQSAVVTWGKHVGGEPVTEGSGILSDLPETMVATTMAITKARELNGFQKQTVSWPDKPVVEDLALSRGEWDMENYPEETQRYLHLLTDSQASEEDLAAAEEEHIEATMRVFREEQPGRDEGQMRAVVEEGVKLLRQVRARNLGDQ